MIPQKIVIESPLAGDIKRNYRYLLWCCRAVWQKEGLYAIGSHLICPWFMDDEIEAERSVGIRNPWAWDPDVDHWFFQDLGESRGMESAKNRCFRDQINYRVYWLEGYLPEAWDEFVAGVWPPHTKGFELAAD